MCIQSSLSEHADAIWALLWKYIADDSPDDDYSEDMAQELCEVVLPQVWNKVLMLDKETT